MAPHLQLSFELMLNFSSSKWWFQLSLTYRPRLYNRERSQWHCSISPKQGIYNGSKWVAGKPIPLEFETTLQPTVFSLPYNGMMPWFQIQASLSRNMSQKGVCRPSVSSHLTNKENQACAVAKSRARLRNHFACFVLRVRARVPTKISRKSGG